MSPRVTADGVRAELTNTFSAVLSLTLGLCVALCLLLVANAVTVTAAHVAARMSFERRAHMPLPHDLAEPTTSELRPGEVDCALTPFTPHCDDIRPRIIDALPTPDQLYRARIDDRRPQIDSYTTSADALSKGIENGIGRYNADLLRSWATERDWSTEPASDRRVWTAPDVFSVPTSVVADKQHLEALNETLMYRRYLRQLWDTAYLTHSEARQDDNGTRVSPHFSDVRLNTEPYDQWLGKMIRERERIGPPGTLLVVTAWMATASAFFLSFLVFGVRRMRAKPVVIVVTDLAIDLDGERIWRHDIADVFITASRVTVVTHDGTTSRTRQLLSTKAARAVVETASELATLRADYVEDEARRNQLMSQVDGFRERA